MPVPSRGVRTLPLHVEPVDGETMTSWLIALARRHHTTLREIMRSLGLVQPNKSLLPVDDDLDGRLVATTAHATAVEAQTIRRLLMNNRLPIPPAEVRTPGRMPMPTDDGLRRTFWRVHRELRFCPFCLIDSAARWPSRWKLATSVICTIHGCLLIDVCPGCGSRIDLARRPGFPLTDGLHCRNKKPGTSPAVPCDANLAESAALPLGETHPCFQAQSYIDTLIDTATTASTATTGSATLQACRQLADINNLATLIVNHVPCDDLIARYLGTGGEVQRMRDGQQLLARYPTHVKIPALLAACATANAVEILAVPFDTGWRRLKRDLLSSATTALPLGITVPSRERRFAGDALDGLIWRARHTEIRHLERLRFRIYSSHPSRPTTVDLTTRAAHIPAVFWPEWTLRLIARDLDIDTNRVALSIALLMTGTRLEGADAALLLGLTEHDGVFVKKLLRKLDQGGRLVAAAAAITRLADYLDTHEPPIDYMRRRKFDISEILTEEAWQSFCAATNYPSFGAHKLYAARRFLTTRALANPVRYGRLSTEPNAEHAFQARLTPARLEALDALVSHHLHDHGIDEPVIWEPPLELLGGPSADSWRPPPDRELVSLLRHDHCSISDAAAALDISRQHLQLYLQIHPLPAEPKRKRRRRRTIEQQLTRKTLQHYLDAGLSARQIASETRISRAIVIEQLRAHSLPVRVPRTPRVAIPVRELERRYLTEGESTREIAKCYHISPTGVQQQLIAADIPRRPHGTRGKHAAP
ncbi:TniQ family protein [Gordonia sp. CPCC 206044]|uniref:TniQ family protein n=1 Tax=Gordonia sp. CPCC 206044 TaxID=3140793 RepID=UPI003AF3E8F8